MYKVMLIDDEKFIRKSLRNRINWERLGLHDGWVKLYTGGQKTIF